MVADVSEIAAPIERKCCDLVLRFPDGPCIVGGLLYGADEMVGAWVQKHLGGGAVSSPYTAVGILGSDGELSCGALWFNRRDGDIELAIYADDMRPSMPSVYRRMLAHPFEVLGASRVTAEIDATNERCIRLAMGLGFRLEGRKRRATSSGGDSLIFGLLPEECPFLRKRADESTVRASTDRPESVECC